MRLDHVADEVAPGGHGTRVAGAVLYGEDIPADGAPQLPFWIQNARVLDAQNAMPVELFPPEALRGMADYLSNVVAIAQKDLDLALALGEGTPRGPSPAVAAIRDHVPAVFGQA